MTDPKTPGLALDDWASAEQSTFKPFEPQFPKCLREVGCPFGPVELPPCPGSIEALTVAEVLDAANRPRLIAEQIFVTGLMLTHKSMTDMGCAPDTCCNAASGTYFLMDEAAAMGTRDTISLSSPQRPDAFRCSGDDSKVCCGFPSAKVIAFGELRGHELVEPRFCRL